METEPLVDDYFDSQTQYGRITWFLKKEYLDDFYKNNLQSGDTIFLYSKPSNISLKQIDAYFQSIGCSRTLDRDVATKIISTSYEYSKEYWFGKHYGIKPKSIPKLIFERHKTVVGFDLIGKVVAYTDSLRPKITFNFETYKNFWNLLESARTEDTKLAAIGMMTVDWTGYEFLLHMLVHNFHDEIILGNLSSIPKFSNWANSQDIPWKNHYPASYLLLKVFKEYNVTEEQITLIKKLLNLK